MTREIITFDQNQIDEMAEACFMPMLGKPRLENQEILKKQRKEALLLRQTFACDLRPSAICKYFEEEEIQNQIVDLFGENLKLEDTTISCEVFANINPADMIAAMLFMISSKTIPPQSDMMDNLYIDMWQTAYLDAARIIIKQKLKDKIAQSNQNKGYMSPSFGPGFYGMQLQSLEIFHKLLQGEDIGVTLKKGLLQPMKSCTGLFLGLKQARDGFNPCDYCIGNGSQCEFCNGGNEDASNVFADE